MKATSACPPKGSVVVATVRVCTAIFEEVNRSMTAQPSSMQGVLTKYRYYIIALLDGRLPGLTLP